MNTLVHQPAARAAKQGGEGGQKILPVDRGPHAASCLQDRRCYNGPHCVGRVCGSKSGAEPGAYALLNTPLDQCNDPFPRDASKRHERRVILLATKIRDNVARFDYWGHSFPGVGSLPGQQAAESCSVSCVEQQDA